MKLKALFLSTILAATSTTWAMEPAIGQDLMELEDEFIGVFPVDLWKVILNIFVFDAGKTGPFRSSVFDEIVDLVPLLDGRIKILKKKLCPLKYSCSKFYELLVTEKDNDILANLAQQLQAGLQQRNTTLCDYVDYYHMSTLLTWAAVKKNARVVELLLKAAGDTVQALLMKKSAYGSTVLHEAANQGRIDIVKLVLNTAGDKMLVFMKQMNKKGSTACDIAKDFNRSAIVNLLKNIEKLLNVGYNQRVKELLRILPDDKYVDTSGQCCCNVI